LVQYNLNRLFTLYFTRFFESESWQLYNSIISKESVLHGDGAYEMCGTYLTVLIASCYP
jgi:hypothetical protein